MSMDRSLKSKAALTRHRNVLSRAERIKVLTDEERWEDRSIFGLPKVAHRKATVGAKKKKEKKAEGEGAEAAPGAATAAPAAGAPAAKAAAPKK